MKNKIKVAKRFYDASKSIFNSKEYQKLSLKCFRSYVSDCILKGKDEFTITFKGKYIQSTKDRIENWIRYYIDTIYTRFLIYSKTDIKSYKQYELFNYGPYKPLHVKVTNVPNELLLEEVLKENGFKIKDQDLQPVDTIYYVTKI